MPTGFLHLLRTLDTVTRFRVWVMLASLLLGIVAASVSLISSQGGSELLLSDVIGLPMVICIFTGCLIWLLVKPTQVESNLLIALSTAALFELIDFKYSTLHTLLKESYLGGGVVWFPMIVVLAFLAFKQKTAIWFSIAYNFIAVLLSMFSLFPTSSMLQISAIIQVHLANFAFSASIAVFGQMRQQYSTIHRQAHTDVLTGIANRRAMQQQLEIVHAQGVIYTLVLLDVDHFKHLNDHYGHAFGDVVLRELAFVLESHTRQQDLAARWGGEEFLLLITETALEPSLLLAKRLRDKILQAHPSGIRITVSMGVAQRYQDDTLQQVIARADTALYNAKNSGRDQVRSTLIAEI